MEVSSGPGWQVFCPFECVVGVPLKSYVALNWTYRFNG
jgi:hypothetical protein